jgi:hypothetical protein
MNGQERAEKNQKFSHSTGKNRPPTNEWQLTTRSL